MDKVSHVRWGRPGVSGDSRLLATRALMLLGWKGRVRFATRFVDRLRGLMGASPTADILVLPHCGSVHTCFMKWRVDIVFVDGGGRVTRLCYRVPPWRFLSCPGAVMVIERLAEKTNLRKVQKVD